METERVPSRSPRRPPHRRPAPFRPRIVSEELFRGVLIKERKRADRLNQPFALLTVALTERADANSTSIWVPVVEALALVTRETDVLGWFEGRTAIGVILPEIHAIDAGRMSGLEARLRQELVRQSDTDTAERLSIRLHIHSEAQRMAVDARAERATIYGAIKRGLDVVGSSTLLTVLLPLILLIAAAVKLKSKGPVFFEQERVGQRMKPFRMLKFRTMRADADPALHHEYVTRFITAGGGTPAGHTPAGDTPGVFKLTNDPRVTPVGRFLRKTSLDELPQLLNVLRGDMSLVGPRPPLAYEVEQYKPWHCRRMLDAKPGITGLWQVTGRSRTTFDEMVRLDLRYARTCSIWNDIKILAATPRAVLSGRGAC